MAATAPVKESAQMIVWIVQAALLREATTIKKLNDRSLLLSLN